LDAHFMGGGDDTAGDFATVGNQDFCKHDEFLKRQWVVEIRFLGITWRQTLSWDWS
jgi:hypothetical protein